MFSVGFQPPFPAPVVIGLGLVVAALVVATYGATRREGSRMRRAVLAGLRLLAVAGIVVVLLRPMGVESVHEPTEKPVFCVLVDTSASMQTPDADGTSRLAAVRRALQDAAPALAGSLAERYDVTFYEFSNDLFPAGMAPSTDGPDGPGMETDVGGALSQAVDQWPARRRAGVLLISDGRENAGGGADRAAAYLKSLNVPVWTVAVGSETDTRDVFVSAWLNQNFMFVKQPARVRATVSQTGYLDRYVKVNLYREGEYVSSQQVMLRGGSARVEFPIREDARGTYRYRVEVEPLDGETDIKNNRRSIFARVVDEKSRVLVVEGQPSWDSKFMLRALRSDPNLQVTSLFYITPNRPFAVAEKLSSDTAEKEAVTAGVRLPRTREELYEYDCILLGRDVDTALTAAEFQLLKDYLAERGGSVVFARGKAYADGLPELEALEPLTWDHDALRAARLELTEEGRSNPAFSFNLPKPADAILRELPEMISVTRVLREKSMSVVLAKTAAGAPGEPIAAIAYQRYGKGKVLSIGTAGLWQWSFLPEKLREYDDVYPRFWGQMMRWLLSESDFLPGQNISFKSDKYTYTLGEPVRLSVWTRHVDRAEYRPALEVISEDGARTVLRRRPFRGPVPPGNGRRICGRTAQQHRRTAGGDGPIHRLLGPGRDAAGGGGPRLDEHGRGGHGRRGPAP